MGIKERHERNREAVRKAILDAARELFIQEGYEDVSIRRIADRIEYSPAAIYSYFPAKEDIFFALAEEGFRLLAAFGPESLDGLSTIDRVRKRILRLYRFSVEHPQHFALMFVDRTVPRLSGNFERFAFVREMGKELVDELQHGIDDGVFAEGLSAREACQLLTMAVMGVAIMRVSGRLCDADVADRLVNS